MEKLKITVLDENSLYLNAFSEALELYPEINVINRSNSVQHFFDTLNVFQPNIIIADYRMVRSMIDRILFELDDRNFQIPIILMSFQPQQVEANIFKDERICFVSKSSDLPDIINKLIYISNYCNFLNLQYLIGATYLFVCF